MSNLAIIPARGGSKGLPRKNLLHVAGLPLIAWSILQARQAPFISTVLVSTDDEEIAAVAREFGAETPFLRPPELARDETPTEPVMLHALDWYAREGITFDTITLLQPTSPLRLQGSIEGAFDLLASSGADSVLGVCNNHYFFWKNPADPQALYDFAHRPRRQDIRDEDRLYRENGSIYIARVPAFRATGNRICGKVAMYIMNDEEGMEIDTELDLTIVSSIIEKKMPR